MGAGIVECDVTFTKDLELVCRHAQSDLHTTTNILVTPLAGKCTQPFTPARLGPTGERRHASGGRVSHQRHHARRVQDAERARWTPSTRAPNAAGVPGRHADFRTDLYAGPTSGHLLTHKESIELFKKLGVKIYARAQGPSVTMPFNGFTQEAYAQKMIDEYKAAGVSPRRVFAQSFDQRRHPLLDQPRAGVRRAGRVPRRRQRGRGTAELCATWSATSSWASTSSAPPMFALVHRRCQQPNRALRLREDAKAAGLDIITWTLSARASWPDGERRLLLPDDRSGDQARRRHVKLLDVLARDVGIRGIFSDWAAPVTYYANCMGIK